MNKNEDKKECGLHVSAHSGAESSALPVRSAGSLSPVSTQAHVGAADVKAALAAAPESKP